MRMQGTKRWKIVTCVGLLMVFSTGLLNAQTQSDPPVPKDHFRAVRHDMHTSFAMSKLPRYEKALARELAMRLDTPTFLELVKRHLTAAAPSVPLVSVMKQFRAEHPSLAAQQLYRFVTSLDLQIRRAKRIDGHIAELLELRLVTPDMAEAFQQDVPPLVTAIPRGDEKNLPTIEAFDTSGQSIALDALHAPDQPVLVVGINAKTDRRAFNQLFNAELRKAGFQHSPHTSEHTELAQRFATDFPGESVTLLTKYYMRKDHEPWLKRGAEIFAVISGINTSGTKPYVYNVDLPSLNYDGKTYSLPDTTLIHWGRFAHGKVNIEFMEEDSGWDYLKIATWVGAFVTAVVTGDLTTAQTVVEIGDKVHQALNRLGLSGLVIDPDDYVDRLIGIQQYGWYSNLPGVSKNVRIDLVPQGLSACPADGTLMRETSFLEVYIMQGCARFHVPSWDEFNAMGLDGNAIQEVADGLMSQFRTIPQDGTLLRELYQLEVYLFRDGKKVHVPSWDEFNRAGLDGNAIRIVPNGSTSWMPTGAW